MSMTKTTLVAKCVMSMTGKGHCFFNDKLKDGSRSLKVWGWSDKEYAEAKEMLTRMGCNAYVRKFPSVNNFTLKKITQVRLYVKE